MNIYIAAIFLIMASTINAQADPFNVTTVLSVPHLNARGQEYRLEFTIQNNQDTSLVNVKLISS